MILYLNGAFFSPYIGVLLLPVPFRGVACACYQPGYLHPTSSDIRTRCLCTTEHRYWFFLFFFSANQSGGFDKSMKVIAQKGARGDHTDHPLYLKLEFWKRSPSVHQTLPLLKLWLCPLSHAEYRSWNGQVLYTISTSQESSPPHFLVIITIFQYSYIDDRLYHIQLHFWMEYTAIASITTQVILPIPINLDPLFATHSLPLASSPSMSTTL